MNALKVPRGLWLALIAFWLGVHLWLGMSRVIDVDELQSITSGWDLWRGQRLYGDFWDNHGPLLPLLSSLIFRTFGETHYAFYGFRLGVWLVTLLVAWVVARIARENYPQSPWLGWLAVLALLGSGIFRDKGFEFRPDNPMNLLWSLSLLFSLRGLRTRASLAFALGGVCLGAVAWFSVKILLLGAAAFCGFCCVMVRRRRLLVKPLLVYGVGVAVLMAALVAYLALTGILGDFVRLYLVSSFSRENRLSAQSLIDLLRYFPLWSLLTGASLWRTASRCIKGTADDAEAFLGGTAAFSLFSYLFLIPTHFLQSALPALVPASLLIALTLLDWAAAGQSKAAQLFSRWAERAGLLRQPRFGATLVVVGLLPVVPQSPALFRNSLSHLAAASDRVLELTRPGEYVLGGTGLPVFRPNPLYYHSLVACVLDWYSGGKIDLKLQASLRDKAVRLVIYDWRMAKLPPKDRAFIQAHYLPLRPVAGFPFMLLGAGGVLPISQGKARVDVEVPGTYWIVPYTPQGQPQAPRRVQLTRGTHELSVSETATTAVLSAFDPAKLPPRKTLEGFRLPSSRELRKRAPRPE